MGNQSHGPYAGVYSLPKNVRESNKSNAGGSCSGLTHHQRRFIEGYALTEHESTVAPGRDALFALRRVLYYSRERKNITRGRAATWTAMDTKTAASLITEGGTTRHPAPQLRRRLATYVSTPARKTDRAPNSARQAGDRGDECRRFRPDFERATISIILPPGVRGKKMTKPRCINALDTMRHNSRNDDMGAERDIRRGGRGAIESRRVGGG